MLHDSREDGGLSVLEFAMRGAESHVCPETACTKYNPL